MRRTVPMKERVARSLLAQEMPLANWKLVGEAIRGDYLAKADAVLDALMGPTEAMVSAVTDEGDCYLSFVQMIHAAKDGA